MVTWDVGSAMLACYKQRFKRRVDMNYGVMTARFQSGMWSTYKPYPKTIPQVCKEGTTHIAVDHVPLNLLVQVNVFLGNSGAEETQ